MRKSFLVGAALIGLTVVTAVPTSAAPLSNTLGLKSAVDTQVTEVRSRRRGTARQRNYVKRDCLGDYDSAGVKCRRR